ncbi:GEVED domain-containing protein [Flavobacterium sp.]|uniref:GEVED domain-containing protein n=1 Tax=Flavobacterium sp. TaxID=239 RepID=UPI0028BEFD4E|nr:GEVED domain-containing protein [Flavobacterium sp.]
MKKITFLLFTFLFGSVSYGQSICTQTFTVSGLDDDPTVLTINASDITCNGSGTITNLRLINGAGSLTSGNCTATGTSWYGFDLSIDGGAIQTGCAADFENTNITGFTTLTITSHDDDVWSDGVTITIDVEVTYTPTAVPGCVVLSSPGNGATGVGSSIIDWPSAAGASGYKLTVGTTPGGTDVLNLSDVGNVLTYDLGALTPGGTYYVKVTPYNVLGDAVGCTESSFTTCLICYCEPTYTSGKTDGDLISNIQILSTTLSNNSGTDPVNPAYTYFTGMPNYTTTLQAGNTYTVSVSVGTFGGQNVAVWIDYNDDGVFDTAERVGYTTTSIGANGTATFQIVLACNPPLGTHRMRVRDVWNTTGVNIDPCTNYGWGETEDYDVTVSAAVACPQPSALGANPVTTDSATLLWNTGCAETLWNVHLTTAGGGAPVGTGSNPGVTNPLVITGTLSPATTYEFYVQADCGGSGTSLWTGPYTFTTNPLPPANDDCSAAVALTVNADFSCAVVTAGTTVGATQSAQADDVSGTPAKDVWFSFVATGTNHRISLTNVVPVVGTSMDMGIGVYDGTAGCASLVFVGTSDPETYDVTGLTAGTTYYVRVYGWYGGTDQMNFNICVGTPPPPPANDECANAIVLTPGGVFGDYDVVGTNASATGSTETAPGCALYSGGDVWYSVVVPASGSLTFENNGVTGGIGDSAGAVYSGVCGALVLIDCDDSSSTAGGDHPLITVTGRTPGEVLYYRVWEYGNDTSGNFAVSAYDASLSTGSFDVTSFKAYPNPVTNVLNLSYSSDISSVEVFNMLGQNVLTKNVNTTNAQVDMSQLNAGAYLVKVTSEGVSKTIKVVKQ